MGIPGELEGVRFDILLYTHTNFSNIKVKMNYTFYSYIVSSPKYMFHKWLSLSHFCDNFWLPSKEYMYMLKALSNYLQDEGRQPNTDLDNLWMYKVLNLKNNLRLWV